MAWHAGAGRCQERACKAGSAASHPGSTSSSCLTAAPAGSGSRYLPPACLSSFYLLYAQLAPATGKALAAALRNAGSSNVNMTVMTLQAWLHNA